jgi:methyl-accepting chemotaxis protein
MLDNIVHLIQDAQSQRDTLQAQVEKLVSEVSGVGEGDLRVQAEVTTDALGVLADSFNYMVEELGSLVVRVKMVASEVENSTSAILDHMTQLVETGDKQIHQIGESVIEVERMSSASRQVAERSQVLNDVAHVARQDAHIGRVSLTQAVEGMGRINDNVQTTAHKVQSLGDRSRQINDIVEVIQSIAHQTNRLALDAAIQAAMAGENGKGFGAVAADIRRLAERSKDQAGIIAQIVRSIREEIGAVAISMQDTQSETSVGTKLTQEVGIALESIFAAVEHQAREIETIHQMGRQQLESSSAIVQIMHSVSELTQQSSLSTREASQNMERLARLVEQLRASVEAFKLRDDMEQAATMINGEDESPTSITGLMRTVTATARALPSMPGISNNAKFSTPTAPHRPVTPSQSFQENSISTKESNSARRNDLNTAWSPFNPLQQDENQWSYNQDQQAGNGRGY